MPTWTVAYVSICTDHGLRVHGYCLCLRDWRPCPCEPNRPKGVLITPLLSGVNGGGDLLDGLETITQIRPWLISQSPPHPPSLGGTCYTAKIYFFCGIRTGVDGCSWQHLWLSCFISPSEPCLSRESVGRLYANRHHFNKIQRWCQSR